ncbi:MULTISPECIES: ATP-binding cassette domain-containing protein [Thermomonosporaceae]|uniref:ATP-binding cassette domain-containing protein n=1 Tax=Thermomonosporaceae TaxID=2012 RepID=UPI00255A790B|nr:MULTISPECIES: ATP-binding cassette domain-containing protein [Thermomonosporaceae]MDL4775685.1 ATP-binding cassette domain-containing protein [Actinomadura xylanilytica]
MGVRRGGRWLLRPVAFGITEGVVGLAGPPGVGKSTLLATFATLRRPHAGALEILGYNTGNASDLRAARARIGYLPGRFSWAENMTAAEFVAYAAYYKRTRASAVRSILKRLDLVEAAGIELALLPPDARLRAGLAATCVHEPDLVLLDDPLSELCGPPEPDASAGARGDAAAMAELIPLIRSLAPTVVVTASTTDTLTGWSDRLLTLARGRLTELPTQPIAPRPVRAARAARTVPAAPPRPKSGAPPEIPAPARPDQQGLGRPGPGPGGQGAEHPGPERQGPERQGPGRRGPARPLPGRASLARLPAQFPRLRARRLAAGNGAGV